MEAKEFVRVNGLVHLNVVEKNRRINMGQVIRRLCQNRSQKNLGNLLQAPLSDNKTQIEDNLCSTEGQNSTEKTANKAKGRVSNPYNLLKSPLERFEFIRESLEF